MACSAVFGTEMWPAAEYGRTMYTIRQRIGPLLMKLQKRDGEFPNLSHATPAMLKCPRKIQAGISALEDAMVAGYDDFK
ncbi:hypothetical protein GW17_00007654, partial [Ensete ventricosum]